MSCNCKQGSTEIEFLTLVPGGTAETASYMLSLQHVLCNNKKICVNGNLPVTTNLNYSIIGAPTSLGNGVYCCKVLCTGTVTYLPYQCECNCRQCPVTDNIYFISCIPCSETTPTITGGEVTTQPTTNSDCCNITDTVKIITSFQVNTPTT